MNNESSMTTTELRGSLSLSMVFFLRMLGLFLVLPVFALYAENLRDATPLLTGIALGCYGLTQALFQIPFGVLSDRFGRKQVITAGLLIFITGSIIAGMADSIYWVIAGRALQGTGAIAAAIMALAADLTRENQRSKAMALIGISVGVAFALAFVAGPVLDPLIGVPGLFFTSAGLALLAIIILYAIVPIPDTSVQQSEHQPALKDILQIVSDKKLFRLNLSIFILHMLLVSSFIGIPLVLRDSVNMATSQHWHIYLPVLLISGVLMLPFLIYGEKYNKVNILFTGGIMLMIVAQTGLYLWQSITAVFVVLVLFFLSFNYLEATLPALISKSAPVTKKGAALGVYSTSQFVGTFIGGLAGGHIYGRFGYGSIFIFGGVVSLIWLIFVLATQNPMQHNRL